MSNKLNAIAKKWDKIEESTGEFAKLKPGAYVVRLVDVENYDEKEYLKLYFDIAEGELKGEFARQHETFGPDWAYDATTIQSYKTNSLPFLKKFITAVERSNSNYSFKETNGDFEALKGKLVVAVFGNEEIPVPDEANDLKPKVKPKFREWRSIEALKQGKIKTPTDVKKLQEGEYGTDKYQLALDGIKANKSEQQAAAPKSEYHETAGGIVNEDDLPF